MGKWLLAILLTHAADPRSELLLVDAGGSTVAASFEHLGDASVHGRLLPGGRAAMVVVDRVPSRDLSFSGVLLRVDFGRPAVELCDRVVHASTPLVTAEGRVFVERGRAGPDHVDELSIDELTSSARTVWRGRGYTAHLSGVWGHELILYMVGPGGASLAGVELDSGRTRTIVGALPPFARDFHVDGDKLFFSNRDDDRRDRWVIESVELAGGARTRLVVSPDQVLAPHPWMGDLAYNDRGLRLAGGARIVHREGADVVAAVSGDTAAVLHYSGGLPALEIVEGGQVRQIATPENSHIQVVGFVQ